jgi:hypothetical protein
MVILGAACNASPVPPSAGPGASPAGSGSGATVGPDVSVGPGASLSPGAVTWPLDIIDGTIALAALDNEVKKAGTDLITAANQKDLQLMLAAAGGLSDLASQGLPSAQRLTTWPATQAAGTAYVDVLGKVKTAADQLAAAIRKGDAAGITSGAQALGTSIEQYRGVRGQIVELVNQALTMRRLLLK